MFDILFPVGSRSLLFGVHQFLWHPWTVYKAWCFLYGKPNWKEQICIWIHDWGYFFKKDMDGSEGKKHPELGAKIANWLFGKEYHDLILYHSRSYAKLHGVEPSRLCWPDKLSILFETKDFYLARAKLSGEIKEYRNLEANHIVSNRSDEEWFEWLQEQLLLSVANEIDIDQIPSRKDVTQ